MGVAHLFSQLNKLLFLDPEANLTSTRMAEASTSSVVSLTDWERVSKLYNRHMSMLRPLVLPVVLKPPPCQAVCGQLMKWANHYEYLDRLVSLRSLKLVRNSFQEAMLPNPFLKCN